MSADRKYCVPIHDSTITKALVSATKMSSDSSKKFQTTWTLNRHTKPFTWDTNYTSTHLKPGDPFAFDHFVRGERILEITALHDACHNPVSNLPSQWSDDDATGAEIRPPPKFPIEEKIISKVERDNAPSKSESDPADHDTDSPCSIPYGGQSLTEHNLRLQDRHRDQNNHPSVCNDELSDDDGSYPDDWDDNLREAAEPLSDEPIPLRTYPDASDNTRAKHRLETLKQFVAAQLQIPQNSRVDTIVFEDPLPTDFLAVDGLTFKHLELQAGVTEEVDLTAVAQLSTSWSGIESVLLDSVCAQLVYDRQPHSGSAKEQWTAIPSTIKTLQLNLATSGFDFRHPDGGFNSLQNFKLVDNYALDLFCKAWRQVPNFNAQVKVLHLISTNGCDLFWYSLQDFRRRLKMCTSVKTLVLALCLVHEAQNKEKDIDTQMADHIPSSMENLSFHFTQSDAMLEDLDIWIEMSRDPAWLPHLRCIRLQGDAAQQGYCYKHLPVSDRRIPYVQDLRFETKIRAIYQNLSQRSPPVQPME